MTEAHRSPRRTAGCAGAADEDEQPDLPEVRRRAQTARGQARLVLRLRELPAVQVHHAVVTFLFPALDSSLSVRLRRYSARCGE